MVNVGDEAYRRTGRAVRHKIAARGTEESMSPRKASGDDCDLVRSVADPRAFERVYDAHAGNVMAFLARRTFDVEAARDLTAETFAQAYRGRAKFRGSTDEE